MSYGAVKPYRGTPLNKNHPLARGLAGCWVMNEGTGFKVFDLSGNGNTGTMTGMTNSDWVPGTDGYALDFDGTDDYIAVGDRSSLQFSDAFTIMIRCQHSDAYVLSTVRGLFNKYATVGGGRAYTFLLFHDAGSIKPYAYVSATGDAGVVIDSGFYSSIRHLGYRPFSSGIDYVQIRYFLITLIIKFKDGISNVCDNNCYIFRIISKSNNALAPNWSRIILAA